MQCLITLLLLSQLPVFVHRCTFFSSSSSISDFRAIRHFFMNSFFHQRLFIYLRFLCVSVCIVCRMVPHLFGRFFVRQLSFLLIHSHNCQLNVSKWFLFLTRCTNRQNNLTLASQAYIVKNHLFSYNIDATVSKIVANAVHAIFHTVRRKRILRKINGAAGGSARTNEKMRMRMKT